jgi:hypothetical protein
LPIHKHFAGVMACSKELLVRAVFSPVACMDVPFLVGRSR